MRHSRLRRTIGLPRACRRRDVPSYLIPSTFSTRHPFQRLLSFILPYPPSPSSLYFSSYLAPSLSFSSSSSVAIFASPFWFIRNTSILRPVVHVKSHPIPFSFPANNRASTRRASERASERAGEHPRFRTWRNIHIPRRLSCAMHR